MSGIEQKIPFGASINRRAVSKVLDHIQNLSGRAPVSLVKATDKTNTVWMVKFETDGTYTLPMIRLPLHTSEYTRVPYQAGAKGFVGAADVDLGAMTGLGASGPASFTRPGNLAALVFHPLGNANFKAALDPNAHETYGASGGTITHDGSAKSLVKTHATDGTSVSSGGDGSGAVGPHAMTTHPENGTSIATTAQHLLSALNATLNKAGDQTNAGKSTSTGDVTSSGGNITAATGNVSAPSGSVSGVSGAFSSLSGPGGGLLGVLKAAATAFTSMSSGTAQVTGALGAATVQTTTQYTVDQLNQEVPPTAALAGTRAYVTDASGPTFLQKLTGGGQVGAPAICAYDGSDFTWVAG